MKITEFIKNNTVILDGAMGTLLQAAGLSAGEKPEEWNISHPQTVRKIHMDYLLAGSNVICTNTFGANRLRFSSDRLEKIIRAAVKNAREAIEECGDEENRWVALDIGPTGKLLKPLGDLYFEDAVAIFAETVKIGAECGVDLIIIETMADSYETKAALLAAKENSSLPVFVSNAYGSDGKLMTGASPAAMIALLEGMGADAIGVNCSLGPKSLYPVVRDYLKYSSLPVIFKPNAGMPRLENGETVYDLSDLEFADECALMIREGVRAVGGCCGTTPSHIGSLSLAASEISPLPIEEKDITAVSSYTHSVELSLRPILIGERINPTGKPAFREAVREGNTELILKEAIGQRERGVDILDVNLGIPGINEATLLSDTVCKIQEICDLPLQIDSADPIAMEAALRLYNGKAMINSVNGKQESLDAVLPLVKKYGGVLVALTLDENGIPKKAEDRLKIAEKILFAAEKAGISKKNIVFDPLAMTVSADKDAAAETLKAVELIKEKLGAKTSLGISNVSFGLPSRDMLNGAFLTMAMAKGLLAAIINPYSEELMGAYYSYLALCGLDEGFDKYISFFTHKVDEQGACQGEIDLALAIVRGLRERAASLTKEALVCREPMDIVNLDIIPALNRVGEDYESKKIFLPSLLMSAEAASSAFEVIKAALPRERKLGKCRVVIATVKGDVHDIGKNIVRLILENYGYEVTDLGKDVAPERIADAVVSLNADILGLSALMTTTLPAMESTVRLVKERMPSCKIMVGGAVLTEEYARSIGADFYGRDAMESVKFAEKLTDTSE